MELTNEALIRLAIFVLGLCGLWVARHIYQHKRAKKPLVCPIRFDCNTVVHSDYSKFLGIPVEILGMLYYGVISAYYFFWTFIYLLVSKIAFFVPAEGPSIFDIAVLAISLGAFIFSLYLILVQIFAIKRGCSWCFVSAFISILIFILTLTLYWRYLSLLY